MIVNPNYYMIPQIIIWTEAFEVNGVRLRASECGMIERFVKVASRHYKKGWNIAKCKPNKDGYVSIKLNGKIYRCHRVIYKGHNLDWDLTDSRQDNSIDHIDGNKSNNTISNLRVATHSENRCNTGKNITNRSGEANISFFYRKQRDNWGFMVWVTKQGMKLRKKSKKMGNGSIPEDCYDKEKYPIPQELIDFRDHWVHIMHGEFARLE